MAFEAIEVEQIGKVRRIWLNRPQVRNAQNKQLLDELDAAIVDAGRADNTNAVILAGRSDHFSAGHDFKERQKALDGFTLESHYAFESRYYVEYCMRIWDLRKPIIAQVQGACIGGGFMVANMCDLVIASEDAYFADPVVQTMSAAATEILVHPWLMGLRRAKQFLYLGERMDAAEAYRVGLVNFVVPKDRLEAETLAAAERIAQASPFTMQLMKNSLNTAADMQGFRNAVKAHFHTHMMGHCSSDFQRLAKGGLKDAVDKNKKL